ncbi:hypothetical protein TNCV_4325281 [Trichonephila clavipes]|nr:hypothetical protein TNCV_4325281 [Trichonephila clavipes]
MSAEVMTTRPLRSFTIANGISYINDFRWSQKKISNGLRFGDRGGQVTGPARPIHLQVCVGSGVLRLGPSAFDIATKCSLTPALYATLNLRQFDRPFILHRRVGNWHTCRFIQPYHGFPNPRIRLAIPPVDGYYYYSEFVS